MPNQNEEPRRLTTRDLAQRLGVADATIRRGYCVDGHYMNMRPIKLPNGRLLWSEDDLKSIFAKRA